jgi:branched-chain amino acid transport system ATP-binding protein
MNLLTVEAIHTYYGKSYILQGISFAVRRGEIAVLLGRNGAGKTTTLRSILGLTPPRAGRVVFQGTDITGWRTHHITRLGVGYVPEGRQVFPHFSVGENLRIAQRQPASSTRWNLQRIFEYFPVLQERWQQKGRDLSGGEQQMLAIGRALAGDPELLILDEPSAGLAPLMVRELSHILVRLRDEGVTILLVEQNSKLAQAVADKVFVVSKGQVVYDGPIEEFRHRKEELKRRFLSV